MPSAMIDPSPPKQPVLHDFCIVGEYRYLIRAYLTYTIRKNRSLQTCKKQEEHFMRRADNKCLESALPKAGNAIEDCDIICTDGQLIPRAHCCGTEVETSHVLTVIDGINYCIDLDRTEVVEEMDRLEPMTREERIKFFMNNCDMINDDHGNERHIDRDSKL